MPYFTIKDFAAGLDLRRASATAPAGTLRELQNCHVTPGGEIEKRASFVKLTTLPATTRGLITATVVRTGGSSEDFLTGLYTFAPAGGASKVDPTSRWDIGTLNLATPTLYEVIDVDQQNAKVFAIIWTDAGGTVKRFYDQVEVTDTNCRGYYCRTYKNKMHTIQGRMMTYSVIGRPDLWTNSATGATPVLVGAGAHDLSSEDSDMYEGMALEAYYDKLAVFSKAASQIWQADEDPLKYQLTGTLRGAGTVAWRSVLQYGSGDVIYLATDGVRSLRARNSSLAAAVSDVGSPIDPVIQDLYRTKGEDWLAQTMSILQPVTGRIWVIMQDRIYVLSAFPGPKITAWSTYIPTDPLTGLQFKIVAACTYKNRVVVRDDQHNVYVYGNRDDQPMLYDDCEVKVTFPFLAGDNPATKKKFSGLDAACEGEWEVYAAYTPDNDDAEDYLGKLLGPTFEAGRFPVEGYSTHMSLRLRAGRKIDPGTTAPYWNYFNGPMKLSNMIMHYQGGEAD